MNFQETDDERSIREGIRGLAGQFTDEYWREREARKEFPWGFYSAVAEGGWLGISISQEYGGQGLGLNEASIMMEEVAASGGAMSAATSLHISIFTMSAVEKHGSEAMRAEILPKVVSGEKHMAIAVTEPDAGLDTGRIRTTAKRRGEEYRISGKKVWISKATVADKLLILARTTPREQCARGTDGLTLFLADLDHAHIDVQPIAKMARNAVDSSELFIEDLPVPIEARIGEEGEGFKNILSSLNPERVLIASEALGIGKRALSRAIDYGNEREVFGRKIGANQGIQFPLADSWTKLSAAELMIRKAAWLFDHDQPCGAEANMAKYLAAEAAFEAADRAVQTHGGMGYAVEYDVERYFKEVRVMRIAPVSQEMILNYLATNVLGLPRSY